MTIAVSRAAGMSARHPSMIDAVLPAGPDVPIPVQPTLEQERLYRKQRLAAGYRLFARSGFDFGGAGYITARDPEFTDCFWISPAQVHFSQIRVSELMLLDADGKILQPPAKSRPFVNTAAVAILAEIHKARPDVVSAAHAHSVYGKTWSTLGRLLDPLTQDSAAFYENHTVFSEFSGVILEATESEKLTRALGPLNAIIMQSHGLFTVGQTVEGTVWRYIAMENACRVQLLAESAGQTRPMRHEVARHAAGQARTDFGAIYSFLPYWEQIAAEEPDLFD